MLRFAWLTWLLLLAGCVEPPIESGTIDSKDHTPMKVEMGWVQEWDLENGPEMKYKQVIRPEKWEITFSKWVPVEGGDDEKRTRTISVSEKVYAKYEVGDVYHYER